MRELLERVVAGDLDARNQLYRFLKIDKRIKAAIWNLTYDNSCVEKDDVEAEFWLGVLKGMDVVRHDVGDPVLHLVQRGVWQVKSVVREEIRQRIIQRCTVCDATNSDYSFKRVCQKCKSPVENIGRYVDISDLDFASEYVDSVSTISAVEVTGRVSPHQRRVLEFLLQACVDGAKYPQTATARALGISVERVNQHLNKLRPLLLLIE